MRKYIERLINNAGKVAIGNRIFYSEELVIDWKDTKTITLRGEVLVNKGNPNVRELEHLTFQNEEVESANELLLRMIGAMYRYDVPPSRQGFLNHKAIQANNVFRPYPLEYYNLVKLHNRLPWLQRKLLLDIYIYSKLASGKIWEGWSHSNTNKDRIWLHKPEWSKPFTVVFERNYLWGDY